jgi:hypothetical protein
MSNTEVEQLAKLNTKLEEHGRYWVGLSNTVKSSWGMGVNMLMSDTFWKNFISSGMNQYQAAVQTIRQAMQETAPVSSGAGSKATPGGNAIGENELARRGRIIAESDAIAANTRKELIGLTITLNNLEKQYSDEKGKLGGTKYKDEKVESLARQIAYTKELIKDSEEYAATRKKEVDDYIKTEQHNKDLIADIAKMQREIDLSQSLRFQKGNNEAADIIMKRFDKEQFETIKAYADFEKDLDKALASADLEHLKVQKQINDTAIARGEAERVIIEIQKAHDAAEIEAEEIKLRYAQLRFNLDEKIAKMTPGSYQYIQAKGERKNLDTAENQSLDDINAKMRANIVKTTSQTNPFEGLIENYKKTLKEIDKLRKAGEIDDKKSLQLKAQATYTAYKEQIGFASDFFGQMASLSRSHNRTMAAIGKAAAIAQATIEGIKAVMNALGAYAPPYSFIMAGVVGAMAAVNIAKIASAPAGYAKGGLIAGGMQNIQVNEQGPEFVVNSQATREFMPLLMAMNSSPRSTAAPAGLDFSSLSGMLQRPNTNISVVNYGTSKEFDVQQLDENSIRIIARDEARTAVNRYAPDIIAGDLASPNSRTSKAVGRNTTARRAR